MVPPAKLKVLIFYLVSKREEHILLHASVLVDNLVIPALFNNNFDNFRGYIALSTRLIVVLEFREILLYELSG